MNTKHGASSKAAEMDRKHESPIVTLGVLNAVHESSDVTQRNLADELGIALGLANAYLKRCVHKGYIKVRRAPARRYTYYLTPNGFAEKCRLTAQYLSDSMSFFRDARSQTAAAFGACADKGWRRLALAGAGELCEIATLAAREHPITIVAIIDASRGVESFAGHPVVASADDARPFDAVLITDTSAPQQVYDELVTKLEPERVLAPALLRVVGPEHRRV